MNMFFLVPYDVHQMTELLDEKVLGSMTWIVAEVDNFSFNIFLVYDSSKSSVHRCFQVIVLAESLAILIVSSFVILEHLC